MLIPRLIRSTVLLCLLLIPVAEAMTLQEADPTQGILEVDVLKLDLNEGFIEYQLINSSVEPLTAIGFNILTVYHDGSRSVSPTRFECIYSAYEPRPGAIPALHSGKGAIWPGQAVEFRNKLSPKEGTQILTAYIEPQAAVMMNRRAVGDREMLGRISDTRRGFFEALKTWVPAFEQTLVDMQLDQDNPVSAIHGLVERVDKTVSFRGRLSRPQQNHARSFEQQLKSDASHILALTENNYSAGVSSLTRRIERYRAQLLAAQNSWVLIAPERGAQ